MSRASVFQSTLPRRERLLDRDFVIKQIGFNPRSREGSDKRNNASGVYRVVSIHAPAKGATLKEHAICQSQEVSIHAPAKGATQTEIDLITSHGVSIHAPAKGATLMKDGHLTETMFQSTLPRRERLAAVRSPHTA